MEDQKRFILAIVLMSVFLYVWFQYFVPKPLPKPKAPAATAEATTAPATAASATAATPASKKAPIQAAALQSTKAVLKKTSLLDMVWTNRPGGPEKLLLRKFRVKPQAASPNVTAVPFMGEAESPLAWKFDIDGEIFSDADATYQVAEETPNKLVFERSPAPELKIRKTFEWSDASYLIDARVELINSGASSLKVKAETGLATGTAGAKAPSMFDPGDPLHATAFVNEKSVRLTAADILKGKGFPVGDIQWAGFDSRYFLLTLIPTEGRWLELKQEAVSAAPSADAKAEQGIRELKLSFLYPPRELKANSTERWGFRLYAGPKDIGILRSAGNEMEHAIDLGDWLGPIARPILVFLRFLYRIIPNYGVAIILLTILVRLLLFPLAHMQAKSFRKMQDHKPQMDALKVKHGDNKEAYSKDLMSYMRTNRINPMGGCLLLLPQMPIFFALYRVLYNSIELRQAPFAFWLHDLSTYDPYYVLPVILGIAMFLQQKMTPTPGADPAQQTMMKIMPVMFTFFMLWLPSGLTLYILISTAWGVGQQAWVQKGTVRPAPAK